MGSGTSQVLKEVEIQILYWNPRGKNIGHVSLFIVDTCLYISFWPDDKRKASVVSVRSTTHTYAQDIRYVNRKEFFVHSKVNF